MFVVAYRDAEFPGEMIISSESRIYDINTGHVQVPNPEVVDE